MSGLPDWLEPLPMLRNSATPTPGRSSSAAFPGWI